MQTLTTEKKRKAITPSVLKKISNLKALDKLAVKINSLRDATDGLVKLARRNSREALAEAILLGQALNEAKALCAHGEWATFLKEKCQGVSPDTAESYRKLAKTAHVRNLNSIREAYIELGIIDVPEPDSSPEPEQTVQAPEPEEPKL